jgi:superfamily II DNA/RNA helicase
MALLDGDRFEGRFRDGVHYADTADMMRRLTKEELLKFDGRPLFPERRARTVKYQLSEGEAALYTAVTEYVRTEMNRVQRFAEGDGKKRNNVGFALQILQRRLASSPAAIYQSLKRRRERLENELAEARLASKGRRVGIEEPKINADMLRNIEEYGQEEIDELEDLISTGATTAETVEQLALEVETLKGLETMALGVLRSGVDTKWSQLNQILDDDLMIDGAGNRRKLIIFTEPKDTLHYLLDKVRARLGNPEAVDVIHGGVSREERRKVVERFMQDKDMLVLIANDAAGEGVNLQRGHLMVNYDLPWNPNKIEQRFGRIHRIGQTEVCHLWNLVAADTREGEVYARLLEKLEAAREALGGRVYDVLGELFEGTALKDLLFQAIQYGEQEEVKARLFQQVDGAVDQGHLLELLRRRALTNDTMPEAKVEELRLDMERAEALRLQPHHIQSFFVEAFQHLGGRIKRREEGRWEITHVPVRIRERDRQIGTAAPVQKQYERICFEKTKINQQPVAAFVCPGHPLLEAVISLIREQYDQIMRQGAILVDDTDAGDKLSAIFLLEHSIQDGRMTSLGKPHVISQRLQFAAIDKTGHAVNAGIAPHLNLRPATPEEVDTVRDLLDEDWLTTELEKVAIRFATVELAQGHVAEVKARRIPEIDKVESEVRARLKKEINYWDSRAFELKEEEKAGKKTRLSWQNAQRRAEDLAERQKRRMDQLEKERFISSQPPRVRGGMVVIPRGLLEELRAPAMPNRFAEDPAARRAIELAAMEAVMTAERALGNSPVDVSAQKIGYDIASHDPDTGHLRFIEVKGRIDGADSVMITRQEIITSLHEPEKFILAVVVVNGGVAHAPRYVRGPLLDREPSFLETAIQFHLGRLLERGGAPA